MVCRKHVRLQDTAPGPVYDTGALAGRAPDWADRPRHQLRPGHGRSASEIETDVQRAEL